MGDSSKIIQKVGKPKTWQPQFHNPSLETQRKFQLHHKLRKIMSELKYFTPHQKAVIIIAKLLLCFHYLLLKKQLLLIPRHISSSWEIQAKI